MIFPIFRAFLCIVTHLVGDNVARIRFLVLGPVLRLLRWPRAIKRLPKQALVVLPVTKHKRPTRNKGLLRQGLSAKFGGHVLGLGARKLSPAWPSIFTCAMRDGVPHVPSRESRGRPKISRLPFDGHEYRVSREDSPKASLVLEATRTHPEPRECWPTTKKAD